MKGWYRVESEMTTGLVRLTMGGFFDSDTIVYMHRELSKVIGRLSLPTNAHLTLCDIREMDIQSQDRVEEFSRLVGSDDIRSRRLAFVVAKSLARLQAKRLTSREGVEFFTEPEAALRWLRQ